MDPKTIQDKILSGSTFQYTIITCSVVSIKDSDPFNYYGEKLRVKLFICYINLKLYQTQSYKASEISNFI